MPQETKHTPLPYLSFEKKRTSIYDGDYFDYHIGDSENHFPIAHCDFQDMPNKDNAEFIVRACNSNSKAIALAYRTLEYVSLKGETPPDYMNCDREMWDLACELLIANNQAIPTQQKTSARWIKGLAIAKAEGK